MTEVEQPPQNGIDLSAGDGDESSKARPADIEQDMREMERRKRVEAIMGSKLFREELERIVESAREGGASGIIQQLSDIVGMPASRVGSMFKSSNCLVPINDIRGIESMGYAKGEKILRCKLAAAFRLLDLYGWTQGLSAHITARLKVDKEYFLVNPYGLLFHEITASSLNKVDMQGNIIEQGTTNFGVNKSLFVLHSAVHAARPDIRCAIYVGCSAVVAISSLKTGVLPITRDACLLGEITTHHYSGSLTEPEEQDKLVRNLGPNSKVLLLSNHGALCCGETIEEAFYAACNIVKACETQIKLIPIGIDNLVLIPEETRRIIYEQSRKPPEELEKAFASALSTSDAAATQEGTTKENQTVKIGAPKWRVGGAEFEALMRMLDNAGYRTGYIYRHPLIKSEPPKPKNDVELPPAVSSLGYLLEEEGMWKGRGDLRKGGDRSRWLNSPNVYQKVEVLETGTPDPKKITKWVAEGSPTHSTPVRIEDPLQFVPAGTNPKEFKRLQQQIKDNRRADKISAGPQSHILEGVTWDEANRIKDATVSQAGDHVVLMGAASKGIIQRGYQHNATVYKAPYAKNPFDNVTDDELNEYKRTVERKKKSIHGEYTDTDFSESEAISSLQTSGAQQTKQITTTTTAAVSQSEPEDISEHHVMRIETQQAPIPSQPEVVLSDDSQEFISGIYNQAAQIAEILDLYEDSEKERVYHDCKNTQFKKSLLITELKKNSFFKRQRCKTTPNVVYSETPVTRSKNSIQKVGSSIRALNNFNTRNSRARFKLPINIQYNDSSSYYSEVESESHSSSQAIYDYVYNVDAENTDTGDGNTSSVYCYIRNDQGKMYKKSVSCNTPKVCDTIFKTQNSSKQSNDLISNIPFIPICASSTSSSSTPRFIYGSGRQTRRSSSSGALSPYRTLSHSGFMPSQRTPVPDHKHIPLPTEPIKYKPIDKSTSFEGIFASPRYIEVCERCFESIFQTKVIQDIIGNDTPKNLYSNHSKTRNKTELNNSTSNHCKSDNEITANSSCLPEYESVKSISSDVAETFASFSSQLEPLLEEEEINSDSSDEIVVKSNKQSKSPKEISTVNSISKTSFIDKIMRLNYSEESANSNFKNKNHTISSNSSDILPEKDSNNDVINESFPKISIMEILDFGNCLQNNDTVSNTNILNDKTHSSFSSKDCSKDQATDYSVDSNHSNLPSSEKRMLMTREERICRKLIFQDLWEDHIHFFQSKENDCDMIHIANELKNKQNPSVHQTRIEAKETHNCKKNIKRSKSLCSYFAQRINDGSSIEVKRESNGSTQNYATTTKLITKTRNDNDAKKEREEYKILSKDTMKKGKRFPKTLQKNFSESTTLDRVFIQTIDENKQVVTSNNKGNCRKKETELTETENKEPPDMVMLTNITSEEERAEPTNMSEVINNSESKSSFNVNKEEFQDCTEKVNENNTSILAKECLIEVDKSKQTENNTESVYIAPALVIETCIKSKDDQSEHIIKINKNCEQLEDSVKEVQTVKDAKINSKFIDKPCDSYTELSNDSTELEFENIQFNNNKDAEKLFNEEESCELNAKTSTATVNKFSHKTVNFVADPTEIAMEGVNSAEYQSVETTELISYSDDLMVQPCNKLTTDHSEQSENFKENFEKSANMVSKLIENSDDQPKYEIKQLKCSEPVCEVKENVCIEKDTEIEFIDVPICTDEKWTIFNKNDEIKNINILLLEEGSKPDQLIQNEVGKIDKGKDETLENRITEKVVNNLAGLRSNSDSLIEQEFVATSEVNNVTDNTSVVEFESENEENILLKNPTNGNDNDMKNCNTDEEQKLLYSKNSVDENECYNDVCTEYEMRIIHDSETNSIDIDIQLTPSSQSINKDLCEESTSLNTPNEVISQEKPLDYKLLKSKEEEEGKSIEKSQSISSMSNNMRTVLNGKTSELVEMRDVVEETDCFNNSLHVSENQSSSYHTAYSTSGQEIDIGKENNLMEVKIDCPHVNQVTYADQTNVLDDKCEREEIDESSIENCDTKSDNQSNNSESSSRTYNVDEYNNSRLSFFREFELYSTNNVNDFPKIDMYANNLNSVDLESVTSENKNELQTSTAITDEEREIIHNQLNKDVKIKHNTCSTKLVLTSVNNLHCDQDTEKPLLTTNPYENQVSLVDKIINSDLSQEKQFSPIERKILEKIEINNLKTSDDIFEKIDCTIRNKWTTTTLADLVNSQLDTSSKSSSRLQDSSNTIEIDFTKNNFLSSTPSPSKCKFLLIENTDFITVSSSVNENEKVDIDEKSSTSTPKTVAINRSTFIHKNSRRSRSFTSERSYNVGGALRVKLNKTVPNMRITKNKPITTVHEMLENRRLSNERNFVLENIRNAGIPRYLQKSRVKKSQSINSATLRKTLNKTQVPVPTNRSTTAVSQPSVFTFKSKESISGSPKFWFSLSAGNSVVNKNPKRLNKKSVTKVDKDPFELKPCESLTCIPMMASKSSRTISNAIDDGTTFKENDNYAFHKLLPNKRNITFDDKGSVAERTFKLKKVRLHYDSDEDASEKTGNNHDKSATVSDEEEQTN